MADLTFLDWPFFSDVHRDLHNRVQAWCAGPLKCLETGSEEPLSVAREVRSLVEALGKAEFLITAVSGRDRVLDARSICLVREVLARHSALADFSFAMQGLGGGAISLFGNKAQRAGYLPRIASGNCVMAFALSESEAGSDVASMTTKAVRNGEAWQLTGSKSWISNAGVADAYTVFARTSEEGGTKGISAFVVDANLPGLRVEALLEITSPHPIGTIVFENCEVPNTALIGEAGRGFAIAMSVLDTFRPSVGAAALGFSRAALDAIVEHSEKRVLFGERLSEKQMTQDKIAEIATNIDASALLVYRAAWSKDVKGGRISREAAMAKLFATESAQQAVDAAVQLFGGQGVVRGSLPERLYRDVRPLRIYEGASEIQKIIIAHQVLHESKELRG